MKKFGIFLMVSTLAVFAQAHAQTLLRDVEVVNKDLIAAVVDELRQDAENDRFSADLNVIVGTTTMVAAYCLAICIRQGRNNPTAEIATMFAGMSISFLSAGLNNWHFRKLALKKELQAQKIVDSIKKRH